MGNKNPAELNIDVSQMGPLESVFRVKLRIKYVVIFAALFLVPVIGIWMFLSSNGIFQKVASLVFTGVFGFPIIYSFWKVFQVIIIPKYRTELKIYQKGFTFQSPKGFQSCLWSEVAEDGFVQIRGDLIGTARVFKTNQEVIEFPGSMVGLIQLQQKYDKAIRSEERKTSDSDPTPLHPTAILDLGSLQQVYHSKWGFGQIFMHLLLLVPLLLFGAPAIFDFRNFYGMIPFCVLPYGILLFALFRVTFQERHDELAIYQNGFTYQSSKELQICSWDDIDQVIFGRWNSLQSIKLKNGDSVVFANAMDGLDEFQELLKF
jgi:hypothetical protein